MKILIWFLSFIFCSIINAFLGFAFGFRAGYWLLYLIQFAVAKKLCDKWDKHRVKRHKAVTASEMTNASISENCTPQPEIVLSSDSIPDVAPPAILFCHKCGEKLITGAKFCWKCGTAALCESDIETDGAD